MTDIIMQRHDKRKLRLRPLFNQCAQVLDSSLLQPSFREGVKRLPDDIKEHLISQMDYQQLAKHYEVLLGKFITSLAAGKWPIIDYSLFFSCLAKECPHLERLSVRCLTFNGAWIPALQTLLQTAPLTSLYFVSLAKGISGECFECILKNTPVLTTLTITSLRLGDDNFQNLSSHPSLTSLSLLECFRLTSESLAHFTACARLRHLALRTNSKWTHEDIAQFCALDKGCTQLQSLVLNRVKYFTTIRVFLPNLTTLKVHNPLEDLEFLKLKCPLLRKLSLKITVTFCEGIAEEVSKLPDLVSFKLYEDQFSNVDYSALFYQLGKLENLKVVKLPCMNGFISQHALTSFAPPIEQLVLMNIPEITDEVITAFSKHLPNLKKLDVSNSSLINPIFSFPYLEVLDSNKINTLQTASFVCPNLDALDISNCPKLESVTWDCPNLATICITGLDKFTNFEVDKMAAACQNLVKVMMSKLQNIDDDVAPILCRMLKLQTLNISDCSQITVKTIEELSRVFPDLTFYTIK